MPRDIEHKLQCGCIQWFISQYHRYEGLLFAVPNGGARDSVTGRKLKDEGVVAGVSDLILFVPRKGYHALCIEMKTEKGRQQETQKKWQAKVEKQGYKYVVCRSIDDFMEVVNGYLN